jgi:uncharacterized protein (TIGR02271 family)
MSDNPMTEQRVSPYTGRPITEQLDEDIELHDADGDEIGNVVEVNPDFIVVWTNTGFLGLGEPKIYYIPRSYIAREDGDDWFLSIDKDEYESMNWSELPTDSAWSTDWREGRLKADQGRGQTRIRRYEEDLEVDKVDRQVGDVTVTKRVVEDTKTVEVPVRREEVHVERTPVSGASTSNLTDDDAFEQQTITVPVMEEDVEIRKVARPVEEVEITKSAKQDTKRVEETVRREEIDVDDSTTR